MLMYKKSAQMRHAVFIAYAINVLVEGALVIGFVLYFYFWEKMASSLCENEEKFGQYVGEGEKYATVEECVKTVNISVGIGVIVFSIFNFPLKIHFCHVLKSFHQERVE